MSGEFSTADLPDLGPTPIDQPDAPPAQDHANLHDDVDEDENTAPPAEPVTPAKVKAAHATGRITIKEIVGCLMDEAGRLNTSERAAVDLGWRLVADPRQKRREALFVAAADMLWRLQPHQHEIKHILARDKPKKKTPSR